ncbi:MAG: hypothetical protein K1W22_12220 [Lachnospiraceae bacterium]
MGAEIDRLEVVVESQASQANQKLDQLTKKLEKISGVLSGINTKGLENISKVINNTGKSASDSARKTGDLSSRISTLVTNSRLSNSSFKKLISTLGNYASRVAHAQSRTRSLSQTWGSFYASFFPVIRGLKAVGKALGSSMDYIETYNYFNVAMGKIATEFSDQWQRYGYDSAEAYTDSFTGRLNELTKKMSGFEVGKDGVLNLTTGMNLGLDPEQIMSYQANIAAVTNSVGLMGENSVNTAKALSMLAADMSSFKNVELSTVMTNFQSGLIGQSRALYKYGIDITNATLQTYAYKYGLSTAVSEMTQADKMQLRLLAILDQSKVAWGDQANTINSVANQYRILKQQISNVARMIGNLLMPVIQAVLPVINGLMIAIQRLIGFVGGLFGIDFSKIMDGISSGYSGIDTDGLINGTDDVADSAGDVGDNFDKASEKAKKLQRTILGFDQINKLNDDSSASNSGKGSGSGSGGVGGAGGIDLSDQIAAALADYEAIWNKAFEDSVNKAQGYADKICAVFNNMWRMIKAGDYEGLGEYIAGGVNLVFEKINSVFNWEKLGPGITAFVDGYSRTINSLVDNIHWENIGKTIGDGVNVVTNTLYLHFSRIDWVGIGFAFARGLNGMVNSIDWDMFGRAIGAWMMKIPKMIYGFVTELEWDSVGTAVGNAINGVLKELDGKMIADGINGLMNRLLTALKTAIQTVEWSDIAKVVGDILGNLDWGTLAKVGLAFGAVKLAATFGSLLSLALSETLVSVFSSGLESIAIGIAPKLDGIYRAFIPSGAIYEAIGELGMNLSIFVESLTGISIPVGAAMAGVVAGIALAVGAVIDLWNTSEAFRDTVISAFEKVRESLVNAFTKVKEAILPLWDAIKELGAALYNLYESSGLKANVSLFATLAATLGGTVISTAIDALSTAFAGLAKVLTGFVEIITGVLNILNGILTLDVSTIIEGFTSLGNGIEDAFFGIVEVIFGAGGDIIAGFFNGILEGIKDIGGWLKENVVDRFVNSFKNLFGIHSPSTVMAELGTFLMQGLFEGISSLVESVVSIFTGIKDSIASAWDTISKNASEVWGNIKTSLGETWENLKTSAGEKFDSIKEKVSDKWEKLKSNTRTTWDNVKTSLGTTWENLKTTAGSKFENIRTKISKAWSGTKTDTDTSWKSTRNSLDANLAGMDSSVKNKMDSMKNTFNSSMKSIQALFVNGWKAIGNTSINAIGQMQMNISNKMNAMKNSVSSMMSSMVSSYKAQLNRMTSATYSEINNLVNVFAGFPDRVRASLNGMYSVGRSVAQSFANGFASVHVPTPHMYASSYTKHTVGDSWFYTPNFNVSWYASGGLFTRPTIAGFGEAGDEAALPLENQRVMRRIASSIVQNMNGKELNTGRGALALEKEIRDLQKMRVSAVQPVNPSVILTSVKDMIQDAIVEVAMAMNFNNDDRPYVINLTVKTEDNEVLARACEKGMLERDGRFNPTPRRAF